MKRILNLTMASWALAASLLFTGSVLAFEPQATKEKTAKTVTKAAATVAPTDKEIADAKAKGLVWVNTNSKIYHKDGEFFGKTKEGKFMTEADAQKAGNRAAKTPAPPKKKATTTKK